MMINKIKNELAKRIDAAGFRKITITMKVNGDKITITPCGDEYELHSFDEVEFYILESQKMNLCGGETLDYVAKTISRYEELLEEDAQGLKALKAHIRKYGENSDWDFVSDYHKDLFGHRPHVPNSQVIAWAHSDSVGSARYYNQFGG